jgi:hypothetical protein
MDKESAFSIMEHTLASAGIIEEDDPDLYKTIRDVFYSGFYFGYNEAVREVNVFTINQQNGLDLEFGLSTQK